MGLKRMVIEKRKEPTVNFVGKNFEMVSDLDVTCPGARSDVYVRKRIDSSCDDRACER